MSNFTIFDYFSICFQIQSTRSQFIGLVLVNVPFILPLCLYIIHLGVKQWRSRAKISHTDFFTYNMVAIQLIGILGSCLLTMNLIFHNKPVLMTGMVMLLATHTAIIIFQILTCLERYLAVVHPVTYLGLKSQTWILIRNISCGLVWLLCSIPSICITQVEDLSLGFYNFYVFGVSLCVVIVLFCNLCVLRVLIRPRPGDGATGNKLKQRVLYTITVIAVTLLVRFAGDLLGSYNSAFFEPADNLHDAYEKSCAVYFSVNWFTLPSTLVLPILFLQRNRKLQCCKTNK